MAYTVLLHNCTSSRGGWKERSSLQGSHRPLTSSLGYLPIRILVSTPSVTGANNESGQKGEDFEKPHPFVRFLDKKKARRVHPSHRQVVSGKTVPFFIGFRYCYTSALSYSHRYCPISRLSYRGNAIEKCPLSC